MVFKELNWNVQRNQAIQFECEADYFSLHKISMDTIVLEVQMTYISEVQITGLLLL